MQGSILWKLSKQSLLAHKKTTVPFVLATSILTGLLYIMISLLDNDYVQNRHEVLPMIITMAVAISGLFTFIFVTYAGLFIAKHQYKEIGLYSVLGMEKKHLRAMDRIKLLIEYLIVMVIGLPGGYLFGHLVFLFLNRLMANTGTGIMDYPFSVRACLIVLILMGTLFLMIHIMASVKLSISNPVALIQSSSKGESEPRSNWLALLIGLIGVGTGYYLALTSEGFISSIGTIFVAVILVVIGSFFLVGSLSIFVLRSLKRRPNYFYQAQNFLSVSGMLYRMKANAVSLTGISILCAGILMILGMTVSTYRSMELAADDALPADYQIYFPEASTTGEIDQAQLDPIVEDLSKVVQVKQVTPFVGYGASVQMEGNVVSKFQSQGMMGIAKVMPIEDYNKAYSENLQLSADSIGMISNQKEYNDYASIVFLDQERKVQSLPSKYLEKNIPIDQFLFVVPSTISLEEVWEHYPTTDFKTGESLPFDLTRSVNVQAEGSFAEVQDQVDEIAAKHKVGIASKEAIRKEMYELNGGALFLGILVTIVLLVGVFLMIYFKQISEGYQDRRNYQIMKQVGLPNAMIKRTIRSQIIWLFGLPIGIALLHLLVSSRLIFNILALVGVFDRALFVNSNVIVAVVFLLAYFLMYSITSRTYYQIVNNEER
ncbi:ABC transporter permease [Facklamia sp. DSM 111018]|uniref:ABC transporter permease n=1 Tax=Facklamia lactis TaxID=2749967 RepID=A0ABS0LSG7_9LACT|nr:ABC transporter permease [Facklamia lactis]MBG9981195.1 ABC transporter permease [Facklamia lactis]MBG9986997.1 ABC transporter permease [Facklamia lactis]